MSKTDTKAPKLASGILLNDYFDGESHHRAGSAAVVPNPYPGQLRGPRNTKERDMVLEAEHRFENPDPEEVEEGLRPTKYSTPHVVPKRKPKGPAGRPVRSGSAEQADANTTAQ